MTVDPSRAPVPPTPDYFHLAVDYAGVLMMLCVSLVAWLGFHLKGADLVLVGILCIGLLGLLIDRLMGFVERRIKRRWGIS